MPGYPSTGSTPKGAQTPTRSFSTDRLSLRDCRSSRLLFRIKLFAQSVSDEVERKYREGDHHARKNKKMRSREPKLSRVIDHLASRGDRFRHT